MNKIVIATIVGLLCLSVGSGVSRADDQSCKARATEKKLSGAAQTSFMKKCETDAATTCNAAAADKKLFGASKTSFTKKCVTDAVGS